jgi:hypothetical protein
MWLPRHGGARVRAGRPPKLSPECRFFIFLCRMHSNSESSMLGALTGLSDAVLSEDFDHCLRALLRHYDTCGGRAVVLRRARGEWRASAQPIRADPALPAPPACSIIYWPDAEERHELEGKLKGFPAGWLAVPILIVDGTAWYMPKPAGVEGEPDRQGVSRAGREGSPSRRLPCSAASG